MENRKLERKAKARGVLNLVLGAALIASVGTNARQHARMKEFESKVRQDTLIEALTVHAAEHEKFNTQAVALLKEAAAKDPALKKKIEKLEMPIVPANIFELSTEVQKKKVLDK